MACGLRFLEAVFWKVLETRPLYSPVILLDTDIRGRGSLAQMVDIRAFVRAQDRAHVHDCACVCVGVYSFLSVSFDPWHVLCRVVGELRG